MATIPAEPGVGARRPPGELLDRVRRELERDALRARNGIRPAAGLCRPRVGQTPKDLVWSSGPGRLWRYRSDAVTRRPPLLLVASLVSRSYVLDLRPGHSLVEHLRSAGFDVFLLDWGAPGKRHAAEGLEDYADRHLPEAVRRTCECAGADAVNLIAYCFGGVLALLYAARHPDAPLRSLTAMATPVDFSRWAMWSDVSAADRLPLEAILDADGNVPACAFRQACRLVKPATGLRGCAGLLDDVWNHDHGSAYQAMAAWAVDHVPFPGAVARQTLDLLVAANGLVRGGVRLGGERVDLRDVRIPILTVMAERDHLVPEAVAAPLPGLVGSQDRQVLRVGGGHVGLVAGRTAASETAPGIADFLRARSEPVGA